MNIYMIQGKDGTLFEPVYLSKEEARANRYRLGMPNPKTTFVKTLVVATPKQFNVRRLLDALND